MLRFTLVVDDGHTLGLNEVIDICSFSGSFDGSNEVNPQVSFLVETLGSDNRTTLKYSFCVYDEAKDGIIHCSSLGVSLRYNDGLMLASDEVTNLGSIGGELIDFTLGVEHGYTLGFDK